MATYSNNGSFLDRDLSSSISETANTVGDKVRDRIDGVGDRLGNLADKAQHGVMDAKTRVQGAATDFQKNSRQMVKDNPMAAVAIGVGVGFILGRILFR